MNFDNDVVAIGDFCLKDYRVVKVGKGLDDVILLYFFNTGDLDLLTTGVVDIFPTP